MRSRSSAFFMSPPASSSALLHSIMPSPVRSRSSLTMPAVMSAILVCSLLPCTFPDCPRPYRIPVKDPVAKKGACAPFFRRLRRSGRSLFFRAVDFHEFVADDFLDGLAAPVEDRVGNPTRVQAHRAAGVVVSWNDVVHPVGRMVGIDNADHRDAKLVGFGNCALLIADIDDEELVGHPVHFLDAAQPAFGFHQFPLDVTLLLLPHLLYRPPLPHTLHL